MLANTSVDYNKNTTNNSVDYAHHYSNRFLAPASKQILTASGWALSDISALIWKW